MPTLATNKIVFRAPDKIVELLEAERQRTGASVSEILRRTVAASLKPVGEIIEHPDGTCSTRLFPSELQRRSQSAAPVLISKASA